MRVLHVIVGLGVGGAELMLQRLVESDPAGPHASVVVSLTSLGGIGESLRARGVTVHALGMSSPLDAPRALWRLVGLLRRHRPAIVQTWMYHSDLWGGAAALLAGRFPVVWNVRSTDIPQGMFSVTYWVVRMCAVASYFLPGRIICCSESARMAHVRLHYRASLLTVIPNGYDFADLQFLADARCTLRGELDVGPEATLIGVVGRFDSLKDFGNFVSAAARVAAIRGDVHFLMVGRGNDWTNKTLRGWIRGAGLELRFHLVGQQSRVAPYLSAMDVFCLSSVSEAFPNVVVEAMAVGLPCVVTRAGDAARILDDEDWVVPTGDPDSLAAALLRACALDPAGRRALGERNARRARATYQIEDVRRQYDAVYDGLLATR